MNAPASFWSMLVAKASIRRFAWDSGPRRRRGSRPRLLFAGSLACRPEAFPDTGDDEGEEGDDDGDATFLLPVLGGGSSIDRGPPVSPDGIVISSMLYYYYYYYYRVFWNGTKHPIVVEVVVV